MTRLVCHGSDRCDYHRHGGIGKCPWYCDHGDCTREGQHEIRGSEYCATHGSEVLAQIASEED